MNVISYELKIKRDADKIHELAQQNGEAAAYIRAAELYEASGDFEQARVCREAAAALSKGMK
jgi:hypothetical protein